jgi:hypothetical protein
VDTVWDQNTGPNPIGSRFGVFSARKKGGPPDLTPLFPPPKKLLREYVRCAIAANGVDKRPNMARDLDVLWRFGMRDNGLSVVAMLHSAYECYGGKSEFNKIVKDFFVTEGRIFFLIDMASS